MADCLPDLNNCVEDLDNCVSGLDSCVGDPRSKTASQTLYVKPEGAVVSLSGIVVVGGEEQASFETQTGVDLRVDASQDTALVDEGAVVNSGNTSAVLTGAEQTASITESTSHDG